MAILQAAANESPDTTQSGSLAVSSLTLTSHAATTSTASAGSESSDSQVKAARWFTFSGMQASPVTLQFTWSISGSLVLTGANQGVTVANAVWRVETSKDGGANWVTALERTFTRSTSGTTNISDGATESITLADTFNVGPVQIRDRIAVDASSTGDPTVSESATLTAAISDIQLSVTPLVQMMVMM